MRILIIHNSYRVYGGEDSVVSSEIAMLKKYGNDVFYYSEDSKKINGLFNTINVALNLNYSKKDIFPSQL